MARGTRPTSERGQGLLCYVAVATVGSIALKLTALNPIRALYWSAVINGILAVPLMAIMAMMAANKRVMGRLAAPWWMVLAGGLTVLIMALATIAFLFL
jgi:Mn2+/Fe2+ NRAMP family transporter